MEPVIITMRSQQTTMDDDEKTELVTTGTLTNEKGTIILSYEDTDATGFAGSKTTICIASDSLVTILRTGTTNSNLTLELGNKHFCLYETPFGSVTLGVQAKNITHEVDASGGKMHMEYTVDISGSFLSENTIEMEWKEMNQDVQEMA